MAERDMVPIARTEGFELFELPPPLNGWRNFRLVSAGKDKKRIWWLGWDGERLADNDDCKLLRKYHPEIYNWVLITLANTHQIDPTTKLALSWRTQVSEAAMTFEARWTQASLHRLDWGLAKDLYDQVNLFAEACVTGTAAEIEMHGEATIKGYAKAVEAMQNAHIEDDAYMLGIDMATGMKVAIGTQKAAVQRVRQIHGADVIWVTPDEVARMLAGVESFKTIGAVKKLFPGAEIIDRYGEEGSQEAV